MIYFKKLLTSIINKINDLWYSNKNTTVTGQMQFNGDVTLPTFWTRSSNLTATITVASGSTGSHTWTGIGLTGYTIIGITSAGCSSDTSSYANVYHVTWTQDSATVAVRAVGAKISGTTINCTVLYVKSDCYT